VTSCRARWMVGRVARAVSWSSALRLQPPTAFHVQCLTYAMREAWQPRGHVDKLGGEALSPAVIRCEIWYSRGAESALQVRDQATGPAGRQRPTGIETERPGREVQSQAAVVKPPS
jgi:hypothetical protein